MRAQRMLPRDASLSAIAHAPVTSLREGHRIRLGLADGRIGLWQHAAPPAAPIYACPSYWRAYTFAANAWRPPQRPR